MFGTLKRSAAGQESYSLELTNAPFSNQRQGSITRNACVRCRVRKAKCTGEAGGCQRCRNHSSECRYPNAQNHRFRRRDTAINAGKSIDSEERDMPLDSVQGPVAPASSMTASSSEAHIDIAKTPVSAPDTDLSSTPADRIFNLGTEFDMETFFDIDYGIEAARSTGASDITVPEMHKDVWPQAVMATSIQEKYNPPSQPADSGCPCALRAIQTHESIEIGLVFGLQYQPGRITDVLQRQKACLADCEALLRCQSCTAKSGHVVLILSMCDKIAYNMEDVLSVVFPRGQRGEDEKEGASPSSYSQTPADLWQSSSPGQNRRCSKTASAVDHMYGGHHQQGPNGHGLQIGLWPLDDEDECGVLRSLFLTRIRKLRSLLLVLQGLAIEHHWPVHRRLIDEVKERFSESFSVI